MGDNKAPGIEENILRFERSRRLYYCGRFGSHVTNEQLDDPFWSPYDDDKVWPPQHHHRTPYGYMQPTYGLSALRAKRAARSEGREETLTAVREPAGPSAPRPPPSASSPTLAVPPPKSSPPRAVPQPGLSRVATASQRSDAGNVDLAPLDEALARLPTSGSASLPSRRHSASVGDLQHERSQDGCRTAQTKASRDSRRSLRSHASMASLRSRIGEAVQKEVARSELTAYYEACEGKIQRARQAQLDMPIHLRTGVNPIEMGCPRNYLTEMKRCLEVPIQKATDPKWSTDIKKINVKIGQRLEWEKKMSASLTGSIAPELHHMPPKDYLSNPPTPYFVPGKAHESRAR